MQPSRVMVIADIPGMADEVGSDPWANTVPPTVLTAARTVDDPRSWRRSNMLFLFPFISVPVMLY